MNFTKPRHHLQRKQRIIHAQPEILLKLDGTITITASKNIKTMGPN